MSQDRSYKVSGKWFRKLVSARRYARRLADKKGEVTLEKYYETGTNWGAHKYGEEIVKGHVKTSGIGGEFNPGILSRLRKGIRGYIKLSRGRLIIKT